MKNLIDKIKNLLLERVFRFERTEMNKKDKQFWKIQNEHSKQFLSEHFPNLNPSIVAEFWILEDFKRQ